jgi:hypothetical protein
MYLSFQFQFAFRIAFRLVQADQSIDPIDSPRTNLRHALGKSTSSACRTDPEQNLSGPALGGLREIDCREC